MFTAPLHYEAYVYDLATKRSTLIDGDGNYPSLRDPPSPTPPTDKRGKASCSSSAIWSRARPRTCRQRLRWRRSIPGGVSPRLDAGGRDRHGRALLDRTSGQTRRLTNDAYEDREPRVGGNLVVWESRRPDDWEVMVYDIGSGRPLS